MWNGRLGFALFGDASNQILVVDDAGAAETPNPLIPSGGDVLHGQDRRHLLRVRRFGHGAVGGPTATYHLSVSVHPATERGRELHHLHQHQRARRRSDRARAWSARPSPFRATRASPTWTSTIVLNHALMADLDAHLRSPAGNDNGLFTDIGAAAVGGQTQMDATFDDEAGNPAASPLSGTSRSSPRTTSPPTRTSGTTASPGSTARTRAAPGPSTCATTPTNASGGTLTAWSLRICEPPPPPACAPGFTADDGVLDRLRERRRRLHALGRAGRVGARPAGHRRHHHGQPGRRGRSTPATAA